MRKTESETTNEQQWGPDRRRIDQHRAHLIDRVDDLRYLFERECASAG
ncbi:hypothetical protein [Rhodococcus sp. JVH1]|nr:hypothetical protein JVH1_3349 [Rhodococcus sp. JVH1]